MRLPLCPLFRHYALAAAADLLKHIDYIDVMYAQKTLIK